MKMVISEGVKEIGQQMIDNPHGWVQGDYEFTNKKHTDIRLWTSNGFFYLKLNGNDSLGIFEKIYLNRCIKKSIANKLTRPLNP